MFRQINRRQTRVNRRRANPPRKVGTRQIGAQPGLTPWANIIRDLNTAASTRGFSP